MFTSVKTLPVSYESAEKTQMNADIFQNGYNTGTEIYKIVKRTYA